MSIDLILCRFPFESYRNYFGEKIGLYFHFLAHYTEWLMFPAIVGIPLQFASVALNDYSAPYLPIYSFFIVQWAIFMLEFWKRRESIIALEWGNLFFLFVFPLFQHLFYIHLFMKGTSHFEEMETNQADFKGKRIKSYINGEEIIYFSNSQRRTFIAQSIIITTLLVLLVVGLVTSIYFIRYVLEAQIGSNAQTVASILNAIQIQIANSIYSFLALELTNRENHRTETQFEDNLIAKIFLFQFVNSYASFFYLAFIAQFFGECPDDSDGGCMYSLTINLLIIFGTRLASNVVELLIPFIVYRFNLAREMKSLNYDISKLTQPEREALLLPYDVQASRFILFFYLF